MSSPLAYPATLLIAFLLAAASIGIADDSKAQTKPAPAGTQVSVQEETFSLSLADASALLKKFSTDAERYKELQQRVEANKARLERLIVVRTISGQQAKGESIHEMVYPTGFEPLRSNTQVVPGAFTPGGFQTRNVGDTLNLTPQIAPDGRNILITLIPESCRLAGYTEWGTGREGKLQEKCVRQPLFESRRLTTSVTVKDKEPFLLGTLNPPIYSAGTEKPKEQRVWLDFITVTILADDK